MVDFINAAKKARIRERQKKFKGWKDALQSIIDEHNHTNISGKEASGKTQYDRAMFLFNFFAVLRELGYKVEPSNLREKHIKVICKKYEAEQLSGETIQKNLWFLSAFCGWIGKRGMIREVELYFNNPESLTRTDDQSVPLRQKESDSLTETTEL